MTKHLFLFDPGIWLGEGDITFSASPEKIHFYTKWEIDKKNNETIYCQQEVEMEGAEEKVINNFYFSDIESESFIIKLENELVGSILGKGIIDKNKLMWEFRGHPNFEGFEVYQIQDNQDYIIHGEYSSPDLFRTIIDGKLWIKTTQK